MVISKGRYKYGEPKNLLPNSVQKPYLPLRGRKLPCFIGGSIGPRMGICETSGLRIPMVPRFHRTNVYIKWKLRVWKSQKGISLVGEETVLISAGPQTTPFHEGSIGSGMQICETLGLRIPMVTHLHQSNGYIKRKIWVWRAQKCIALVGAVTELTSAGPQTTPFHGGQYRDGNGNMQNFGPTNPNGTAFPQEECLHLKETTGMENKKNLLL